MLGAAVILTADGYLLTAARTPDVSLEIALPGGRVLRPIPVARDAATGLLLLKVAGEGLAPVRLATGLPAPGASVFAAGYDPARSGFGQIGGHLRASDDPALLATDIPLAPGFNGGAVVDQSGAMLGLIVADAANPSARAVSVTAVIDWLDAWRRSLAAAAADSYDWPVLPAAGGVELQYPSGWSVLRAGGGDDDYRAEMAPGDPDAPLTLALSIEPSPGDVDPLAFAAEQFGDRKDAILWGAVSHGGLPGVRVRLSQEGARVDLVYLFDGRRRIAVSLTSGYGDDDREQAARVTALFEAVLRSIRV